MKFNLRIQYSSGEEKEIVCSASDMVKFEDRFDQSVAILESRPKLTYLLFLAWCSETRTKGTSKEFDVWVDEIDNVRASDIDPK